jgi:hypothetical protein
MKNPAKTAGEQQGRKKNGQFEKGTLNGTPFKPGESGNPNGRRDAISDIMRRALDAKDGELKKYFVNKLVEFGQSDKISLDDFTKVFDRILDRTEGKPTQPTADVSDGWQKYLDGVFEPEQE